MAAETKKPIDAGPFGDLSKETIAHLDAIGAELDKVEARIKALEEIGMDVSRLREQLEWGRKARDVILRSHKSL